MTLESQALATALQVYMMPTSTQAERQARRDAFALLNNARVDAHMARMSARHKHLAAECEGMAAGQLFRARELVGCVASEKSARVLK